jgi:hypothetical protein
MRNMIRMRNECLLGHPFITSVAWVSFVGLVLSMWLKLEYPLSCKSVEFHYSHPPSVVEVAHAHYRPGADAINISGHLV